MLLQVKEGPLILLRFLGIFMHYLLTSIHGLNKYCIFTKLLQIMCLINVQILVCTYGKCDCRLWKAFYITCVFDNFSYIILHVLNDITSSSFYRMYVKAEVKKCKLCKNLWLRQSSFCNIFY